MRWAASDVSPSSHLAFHIPNTCRFFVLCCVLGLGVGVFVALSCFCFLFCKGFGIPNSPRSLDLDDRQGLIASSAMQQKKKPHRLINPATNSSAAFRWECIRSSGAVTRCMPITWKIHQSNRPTRANVSSVGPCTEDHSDQLLASVEAACDPCDRDRVSDMITLKGQINWWTPPQL